MNGRVIAVVMGLAVLVAAAAVGLVVLAGTDPMGTSDSGGEPARNALLEATPNPFDDNDDYVGYLTFDAPHLNRQGRQIGSTKLQFVDGSEASTGPTIVSVLPVSQFEWRGAALSDDRKECWTVVATTNPSHPEFGDTKFHHAKRNGICTASA